jgi:hypothetical protein
VSERRFTEEEVSEILKRAAELDQSSTSLAPSRGMTLAELESIAREAGISPAAVQQAAKHTEASAQITQRLVGLPIGVGRTVELERKLTDDEWARVVADLRTTFDARGRLRDEGPLRSWSNGNLQANLEPTSTGQRLRLRTFKANAQAWILGGMGMIGIGAIVGLIAAVNGTLAETAALGKAVGLMAGGSALIAIGALTVPAWARLRRRQMDEIADRVTLLSDSRAGPDIP